MNVLAQDDRQLESTLFQINMNACEQLRPSLWKLLTSTEETERYRFFQSEHESRAYNLVDVENEKLFYELDDPSPQWLHILSLVSIGSKASWSVSDSVWVTHH